MKISVSNFKGIKNIDLFTLERINILTGVNSGGKSSLIQLLLLIKQSLEARSIESPLKLNRPYLSLGKFENILRKGSVDECLSFSLVLAGNELSSRLKRIRRDGDKSSAPILVNEMTISVSFKRAADRVVVDRFALEFSTENQPISLVLERNRHGKSYRLETNAAELFFEQQDDPLNGSQESVQVSFFSFFPDYINIGGENEYFGSLVIDHARLSLQRYFAQISYIGPLREEPRDFYFQDDDLIEHIGNKGENAAYILAKHAKDLTKYVHYTENEAGELIGEEIEGYLEDAVNHWMCDIFRLGKKIKVDTSKGNRYLYTVSIVGSDATKVPITHVGFGVSQIFPILVEGLRPGSSSGRTIILEQPEIHLHPRVQSWLFDFVATVSSNVSFLIETHSDHFITRLRRRIAEAVTDDLLKNTNLTFVEPVVGGVEYTRLNFNDIGSLDCWPNGFFDQYESDMRALVQAQAKKRKTMRA